MAITWANILEWKTGPLDEIAQTLFEASQGLREAYEKGQDHLNALQSEGEAVTAMRATTITNLASLERALTNVNGALMAIEGARDQVGQVMVEINEITSFASANECTIHQDGSVSATEKGKDAAQKVELGIETLLEKADQVDTDLYHALQDINNDRYTDGDGENNKVIGVPDLPQPNWSPSQVAAWWKSLTDEQQQFLIRHRPDDIRHLDGLPATARGLANRFALEGYVDAYGNEQKGALAEAKEEYDKAREKYGAILKKSMSPDRPPTEYGYPVAGAAEAEAELERAKEKYEDLLAIQEQTNNDVRMSNGLAPAYLLDFNYDEKYHRTTAIVSAGNPDTATHVSTLVPGIGTNVRDSLGQYMDINDRLREQTKHAGVDPNNVAAISYLGYVAPRNDGTHLVQAMDIGYAERGAPKIAQFEEGLRASANANNHKFTNTLLTHSFGSTTGGKSATMTAPGTIDRLILTGSPGSGVQSIDEYNVPKENVYVSAVYNADNVQGLGFDSSYGVDPQELEGITHLSGDARDAEKYHQGPAHAPLFTNIPVGRKGYFSTVDLDNIFHPFTNHMAYFEEGTRTSQDFANIIAGGNQTTDEEWAAIQAERGK